MAPVKLLRRYIEFPLKGPAEGFVTSIAGFKGYLGDLLPSGKQFLRSYGKPSFLQVISEGETRHLPEIVLESSGGESRFTGRFFHLGSPFTLQQLSFYKLNGSLYLLVYCHDMLTILEL